MTLMRAMTIERMGGGREATKITDLPYPECGDNQIIVKVMAASICKHCEEMYDNGAQVMTVEEDYPIVLGHEFAGEVVEVGKKVRNLKQMCIRDRSEGKVSVRSRFLGDEGQKDLKEFMDAILEEIRTKEIRKVEVEVK